MEGKIVHPAHNLNKAEKITVYLRESHKVTELFDVTAAYKRNPNAVRNAVIALNNAASGEYDKGESDAKAAMRKALGLES